MAVNNKENHWMPFTANRDFKSNPRMISKAKGMYFYNQSGSAILDASSSLFCTPLGHGRKEIAQALYDQILTNDYTPSFQLGHDGSFELANSLALILPSPLNHVFFTNSGSEAVDTALKIADNYHRLRKESSRYLFVSRERAYHGVGISGTSLSGMVRNRRFFNNCILHNVAFMRHTQLDENRFTRGVPEKGVELADDLQTIINNYGADNISACFVEPIAGSCGCIVPPKGYLQKLREICTENGILLIFDEVITGFGRCGTAFASDAFDVVPDIITMAKALTNGNVPMGAVAVRDDIYDTFCENTEGKGIEFYHGYTWSGNPTACACANAVQKIFRKEKSFEKSKNMSPYFIEQLHNRLENHPRVTDIRSYGMMAGVDLKVPGLAKGASGPRLQKELFYNGLHIKCTGDTAILAPAFVAEKKHIDQIIDLLEETLSSKAMKEA